MNHKSVVSAAAALLVGVTLVAGAVAPVAARDNDPAKKQEQTAAKADTRKYCIDTMATGSRVPKRDCRTRADWLEQGVDPVKLMQDKR